MQQANHPNADWPTIKEFLDSTYPDHVCLEADAEMDDEQTYGVATGLDGNSRRTLTGAWTESANSAWRGPRERRTMPSGKAAPTR